MPKRAPYTSGPIDKEYEFIMNCYGIGYDAANGLMLTGTPGVFDESTVFEVRSRFALLKKIARKRFPQKLGYIERCEQLTLLNIKGKISDKEFLRLLRDAARKAGGDDSLARVTEVRIDNLEKQNNIPCGPPGSRRQHVVHPLHELLKTTKGKGKPSSWLDLFGQKNNGRLRRGGR